MRMTAASRLHTRPNPMTRMSRCRGAASRCGRAKGAYRLARALMARVLLNGRFSMSGALLVGALASQPGWGCVLPPDLEPEGPDAGPSSPPIIVLASPPELYAFPGPVVIARGQENPLLTLVVEDNDLADSIYVRLYRDYGRDQIGSPTPALVDCGVPGPSPGEARNVDCTTNALCTSLPDTDNSDHVLEAMVADQPFIADSDPEAGSQPTYRALANRDRAGWSLRAWTMRCQGSQ